LFLRAGILVSIGLTRCRITLEKRQFGSLLFAYWFIKDSFALFTVKFLVGIMSSS